MKFSHVIIATVSLVLLGLILDGFLLVAFIPLNSDSMSATLAFIIAFLVASFIVGYVFALKIHERSSIKAIGVIVVLCAFTMLMFYSIWLANLFGSYWFRDYLNSMFNTSGWTNYDWNAYSELSMYMFVIVGLAVSFIGLYVGSMLRKSSAKTKE